MGREAKKYLIKTINRLSKENHIRKQKLKRRCILLLRKYFSEVNPNAMGCFFGDFKEKATKEDIEAFWFVQKAFSVDTQRIQNFHRHYLIQRLRGKMHWGHEPKVNI